MFKKDLYMKVVFTIIALSLCVIAIRNTELIKKAEAYGSQDVNVTNAYEIGSAVASNLSIKTLRVRVTNTPGVRVTNIPISLQFLD